MDKHYSADIDAAAEHVHFRGQSGHYKFAGRSLLMTESGKPWRLENVLGKLLGRRG
jgi:hypothetical protein